MQHAAVHRGRGTRKSGDPCWPPAVRAPTVTINICSTIIIFTLVTFIITIIIIIVGVCLYASVCVCVCV